MLELVEGQSQPEKCIMFNLELTKRQVARLDEVVMRCGLQTRKDLLDSALTMFNWAVLEIESGRKIASFDPDSGDLETIGLPNCKASPSGHGNTGLCPVANRPKPTGCEVGSGGQCSP